jgi:hypothetical protein
LEKKEKIKFKKCHDSKEDKEPKQVSIRGCLGRKKDPPEVVLARLVALDCLPFNKLEKSIDIQDGWRAQGLKIPSTRKGMRQMFISFATKIKEEKKNGFAEDLEKGDRFSVSLDEWTSHKNRRYMCLNLHAPMGKVHNLGMKRIIGSMKAEDAVAMIEAKLNDFGLCLQDDILGMVTDGASVMVKTGRLSNVVHQLCHSHGIHLAVADVLYKPKEREEEEEEEALEPVQETTEDNEEDDSDNDDANWHETCVENPPPELNETIGSVINKIRTLVRSFRKSPLNNDLLQKNCLKEYGKELTLLLDTKTRCALMHIKKEMTFYEATNECPKFLKHLKHCLESHPPSSAALVQLDFSLQSFGQI